MELVKGKTLQRILKDREGAPFPTVEALQIARQVAEGLEGPSPMSSR